jgi:hypothetical protein
MHNIDLSEQLQNQVSVIAKLQAFLRQHKVFDTYNTTSFQEWTRTGIGVILYRIIDQAKQEAADIDRKIADIKNSRSWRLTVLLRKTKRLVSKK